MAGRRSKLTPEVLQLVVSYVRGGAYAWVAAQAAGIAKSTYFRWMERGERSKSGPYREFFDAVTQAHAQARVTAEVEVRREDPFKWLRYGAGRERPGEPGWTDSQEVAVKELPKNFTIRIFEHDGTEVTDDE